MVTSLRRDGTFKAFYASGADETSKTCEDGSCLEGSSSDGVGVREAGRRGRNMDRAIEEGLLAVAGENCEILRR